MERLSASFSPPAQWSAPGAAGGTLARFADLADALEHAARAIARLDALLTGHPLGPAWLWRIRLEAVRRQAAADGRAIDPWHLAALIEGIRFRMDRGAAMIDRGTIFAAARHALGLWGWFARPDEAHSEAIGCAGAVLSATDQASPLLGAALGVRAWLDRDGERPPLRAALAGHWQARGGGAWPTRAGDPPPLRAALAGYWQRRGLLRLACPLLTGAKALTGGTPWEHATWAIMFLAALAEGRESGTEL